MYVGYLTHHINSKNVNSWLSLNKIIKVANGISSLFSMFIFIFVDVDVPVLFTDLENLQYLDVRKITANPSTILQKLTSCHDLNPWNKNIVVYSPHSEISSQIIGIGRVHSMVCLSLEEIQYLTSENLEFFIKHDDGQRTGEFDFFQSDIVLLGPSKVGKTSISMHLACRGYKVLNLPIIYSDIAQNSHSIEKTYPTLHRIIHNTADREEILVVALTMNAKRNKELRMQRELPAHETEYVDISRIAEEMRYLRDFAIEHHLPVLECCGSSGSALSDRVSEFWQERKNDYEYKSSSVDQSGIGAMF
ncbi:hypothetical protein PCE1_003715 [Barthelona sp. PCE]